MRCYVCGRETPPRQRYCDRCRIVIVGRKEQLKRRAAMREAYDRDLDGFRDHWSGVLLDGKDRTDPFHMGFDHYYPVRTSRLVVCSELSNFMKTELGPDEFPLAVEELTAHHAGRPFDRDFIGFEYWKRRSLSPPEPGRRLRRGELTKVLVEECIVCGRPPRRWSYCCERCRRFVYWRGYDRHQHARAMKESWSPDEDGFLCYYTGARVVDDDPRSPWYLTFDHRVPGEAETIVVAASWVNAMKTALSEEEFWAVVGEYDRYLREGGEFDRDVAEFRYWRRKGRPDLSDIVLKDV